MSSTMGGGRLKGGWTDFSNDQEFLAVVNSGSDSNSA